MAQQGKQMRVGAREGFAYHLVELVILANGNIRYEADSNMFFSKWQNPLSIWSIAPFELWSFLTHIHIYSLWSQCLETTYQRIFICQVGKLNDVSAFKMFL